MKVRTLMTDSSSHSFIKELNGQKVIVVHTLHGDINVSQEAVEQAYQKKQKNWRRLSYFLYPTDNFQRDFATNFPGHLLFNLHRTFRDNGYTEFNSLIEIQQTSSNEFSGFTIRLISQHPRFVSAIHRMVKRLWDVNEDRATIQNDMNAELIYLQKNWLVTLLMQPVLGITAYQFIYDPKGQNISIRPNATGSTNPSDYEKQVTTTSELFTFLVAYLRTPMAVVDFDVVLRSYGLLKLMVDLLDGSFSFERFRLATSDPEEWDYINPTVDQSGLPR